MKKVIFGAGMFIGGVIGFVGTATSEDGSALGNLYVIVFGILAIAGLITSFLGTVEEDD